MPRLEVLGVRRTEHYTLGPIMHDEGTKKGQYGVTDTIFKQQFKLDPDLFGQRLWLIYGDQKTV